MKRGARASAPHANHKDGFVLIAVLWILAALAGLVGAYVAYALTMAQSADFYLRRVEADAALAGALEQAIYDVSRMEKDKRPLDGILNYRIGGTHAQVRYASETLRLDLNKAPLESLTAFLGARGGGARADRYARRILAWREQPGGQGAAMEDLSYRAAGVNYLPRHGPYQSVEELWDVLELPPELVARILPYVTVYGGREKWEIDPNGADGPQNAGVSPPATSQVGAATGAPPQDASPDTAGGEQSLMPTRFEIRVTDAQGRVNAAEVVAMGARDGDTPYNVLLWRSGESPAPPRDVRR